MQAYTNGLLLGLILVLLVIAYLLASERSGVTLTGQQRRRPQRAPLQAPAATGDQLSSGPAKPMSLFEKCQSGDLTAQRCWEQRVFQCPRINGSYKQCTNNYVPQPLTNYCSCEGNRDVCPWPYKINSQCFVHGKRGNKTPQEFEHPTFIENNKHDPPRINVWNADGWAPWPEFMCQCN